MSNRTFLLIASRALDLEFNSVNPDFTVATDALNEALSSGVSLYSKGVKFSILGSLSPENITVELYLGNESTLLKRFIAKDLSNYLRDRTDKSYIAAYGQPVVMLSTYNLQSSRLDYLGKFNQFVEDKIEHIHAMITSTKQSVTN